MPPMRASAVSASASPNSKAVHMDSCRERRPFFSIIVPCCNVARYLDEMSASLLGQSFADWECILSVETSSDETAARCEAWAAAEARVRVVSGPRSGSPATPRNRGLALARGRYVIWLDGDDWLADEALARLAAAIRAHGEPEVVQAPATECREDADGARTVIRRHVNYRPSDVGRVLSGEEAMVWFSESPRYILPMATFSVCRRAFLLAHGLTFQPGLKYEDNEWTARLLTAARRLLVVDFDLFVYRRRADSITTAAGTDFVQYAAVVRHLFFFLAGQRPSRRLARAWARRYLAFFFDLFFSSRYPAGPEGFSARARTACLRRILEKGGRRAYLKLTRAAGPLKMLAAPFVLLCGLHPLLDVPARLYFRLVYAPLVRWRVRANDGGGPGCD